MTGYRQAACGPRRGSAPALGCGALRVRAPSGRSHKSRYSPDPPHPFADEWIRPCPDARAVSGRWSPGGMSLEELPILRLQLGWPLERRIGDGARDTIEESAPLLARHALGWAAIRAWL